MPKAKKTRVRDTILNVRSNSGVMDVTDAEEMPFKPSVLAMDTSTSKPANKRKGILLPEDPSPHDGMNQEESEKALLDAIMPNLPRKGLSAPAAKLSRGALLRQHKLETRELRETIRKLKDNRTRLNGNARNKREQKSITQEIKTLEDDLLAKQEAELQEFDKKNDSISKRTSNKTNTKINFNSINLNFGHISFEGI